MIPMPMAQRRRLTFLPRMNKCERANEGDCRGSLTWEHTAGRKNAPDYSIICLCWQHHLVDLNKELNRHIAFKYATEDDLKKSKRYEELKQEKKYLNEKYG